MSDLRGSPIQIDPSISLHAGAGLQQPTSLLGGNPISAMTGFAEIQNRLNQNKLFQQTFAARQMSGQILSQAPDLETGLQQLYQNPLTAPFAGEVANSVRQGQQTLTAIQGAQQQQAHSVFDSLMKGLPALYNNPGQWDAVMQSSLALAPPGPARQMAANAIDSVRQGLMTGVDPQSPMAVQQFQKNLHGWMLASGMTPEMLRQTTGEVAPSIQMLPDAQGAVHPTLVGPGGVGSPVTAGGVQGGGMVGAGFGTGAGGTANRTNSPLPGSPIVGPTLQEKTAQEAYGRTAGDIADDMSTRQQSLPANLRRLDMMSQAMTQAQLGGGAEFRASIAQNILQSLKNGGFPIDQKTIDKVGNSSLVGSELFSAEVKPLLLAQLKDVAAGRFLKPEVEGYFQAMNTTTDPQVALDILNQARYTLQTGYHQAQAFPVFKQLLAKHDPSVQGLDIPDFFGWYNKTQAQPAGSPEVTQGGLNLGPTSTAGIKGIPGPVSSGPVTPSQGQTTLKKIFGTH